MSIQPETSSDPVSSLVGLHGKFLQFLRGRIGDEAVAEDILQAAYLKALEHGGELREAESSVAWFYRVLRNAIVDYYRQRTSHSKAMDRIAVEWAGEGYQPELKAEICACILQVVRNLKPEYRLAVERVDLAGESVESFAQAQNATVNNTYVKLHRARKMVAKTLLNVCGTCATHKCVDCTCKR